MIISKANLNIANQSRNHQLISFDRFAIRTTPSQPIPQYKRLRAVWNQNKWEQNHEPSTI